MLLGSQFILILEGLLSASNASLRHSELDGVALTMS